MSPHLGPHLGPRISLLLDGRLSPGETERAWEHVHTCHACRDQVEREGWVKTRLAGLDATPGPAPAGLKGALLGMPPGDRYLPTAPAMAMTPTALGGSLPDGPRPHARARRTGGIVALSGGAAGAAVLGVLALGTAPAEAPVPDRRAPLAQLVTPSGSPVRAPGRPTP